MTHAAALLLTTLWFAANVYLWSLRQAPTTLFLEALGMAAIGFPALYWYVVRGGSQSR